MEAECAKAGSIPCFQYEYSCLLKLIDYKILLHRIIIQNRFVSYYDTRCLSKAIKYGQLECLKYASF